MKREKAMTEKSSAVTGSSEPGEVRAGTRSAVVKIPPELQAEIERFRLPQSAAAEGDRLGRAVFRVKERRMTEEVRSNRWLCRQIKGLHPVWDEGLFWKAKSSPPGPDTQSTQSTSFLPALPRAHLQRQHRRPIHPRRAAPAPRPRPPRTHAAPRPPRARARRLDGDILKEESLCIRKSIRT